MPTNGSCCKFKKLIRKNNLSRKRQSRKNSLGVLRSISSAIRFKDFRNFQDCIPITVRGRNSEKLLNLPEVSDCFHVPSIKAQNELFIYRDNLE